MKLDHVAHAHDLQAVRNHPQAARRQGIAPALEQRFVVGAAVHQAAVYRALVVGPQLLDVDQRPLTRAQGVVLYAGQGQIVLLRHPMISHRTPSGRSFSSTDTS